MHRFANASFTVTAKDGAVGEYKLCHKNISSGAGRLC